MKTSRLALPLRYLLVGAFCALIQNAMVIGGDFLGCPYPISTTISTILVGGLGYCLHARLTYRFDLRWSGYIRFLVGNVSGYVLSLLTLAVLHDLLSIQMLIASPLTTVVTTAWNFMTSRWAITHRRKLTKDVPQPG